MEWHLNSLFKVYCGVHQGGILSPVLFNIYADELVNNLYVGLRFKNLPRMRYVCWLLTSHLSHCLWFTKF